jgi:hypothetical protein
MAVATRGFEYWTSNTSLKVEPINAKSCQIEFVRIGSTRGGCKFGVGNIEHHCQIGVVDGHG